MNNKQTVRLRDGTELLAEPTKNGSDVLTVKYTSRNRAECRVRMLGAGWGVHQIGPVFYVAIVAEPFTPAGEPCMYSFNFIGGGTNSVCASSFNQAIWKAKKEFGNLLPLASTFRRLDKKSLVEAYYKDLPLMD